MSAAQHTPGPWHVVRYGDGDSLVICTDKAGNQRIAFMAVPGARLQADRRRSWKQIQANACVIAAAPELLEANQSALTLVCDLLSGVGVTDERLNHVAAALLRAKNKATGA